MDKAQSADRFYVGYKVLDLKYRAADMEKTLTAAVWYPTAATPKQYVYGGPTHGKVTLDAEPCNGAGPYPLIVFSHGYGGCGLGAAFFTEALAARGWIVVAPDHHDRHNAFRIRTGRDMYFNGRDFLRYARKIARSAPEDRHAYLYRLDEMKLALDGIVQSRPLAKLIDREKMAVGGHSFGGFTALGLCGTIEKRRDRRIKAVLLFSTGAGGYLYRERELANVKMPSMYFLGELERNRKRGNKTMGELADKVYRNLSPPKYFLEIKGANHFSFNNQLTDKPAARFFSGKEDFFKIIRQYSIAFLEKHVAGKKDSQGVLDQQDPSLTRYLRQR